MLYVVPTDHISQSLVSLRRIEKYLHGTEVAFVPPLSDQTRTIALQSATVTWPQDRSLLGSRTASAAPTPRKKFILVDLSVDFPVGKLSLICGKLGSGKTLLLLGTILHPRAFSWLKTFGLYTALLGEVDLLTGQVLCPRSPPDSLASFAGICVAKQDWIVEGICAYVPQVNIFSRVSLTPLSHFNRPLGLGMRLSKVIWTQRVKPFNLDHIFLTDNILFNLPFDEERYQKTLEVHFHIFSLNRFV